jgi:hypothetical protein
MKVLFHLSRAPRRLPQVVERELNSLKVRARPRTRVRRFLATR